MAKLRTAMDAAFWDLNIATPQALDGVCMAVPGENVPPDGARASKLYRFQQLASLRGGFPFGLVPSYSAPRHNKELGPFALHTLLSQLRLGRLWVGLVGQIRPKKVISAVKNEIGASKEWDVPLLKNAAKHFQDKSLYAFNLCTQIALTGSTVLQLSKEKHEDREEPCTKFGIYHRHFEHDVTIEAAWPQLFIDGKGKYWEVPEMLSVGCMSLISDSGLRYRFGIQRNNGLPQAVDSNGEAEAPPALLPGLCAKTAFSFEKSKDFWRMSEMEEDVVIGVSEDGEELLLPSYDFRLREPHAAISGIVGVNCESWLSGVKNSPNRGRLGVDLFGSVCYTYQHGKFRKTFNDLTRIDARLEIASAKRMLHLSKIGPNSPTLNLIFQQQIGGPLVFRVDWKHSLKSLSPDDVICSLNCSLRALETAKAVAWYSPKRKEGMVELRFFEF